MFLNITEIHIKSPIGLTISELAFFYALYIRPGNVTMSSLESEAL